MFLIKKLIIVVAILLVAVFSVSFVSRSIEIGNAGSSADDGHTGIGFPADSIELLSKSKPLNDGMKKTAAALKNNNVLSHDGERISYKNDNPNKRYYLDGKEYAVMQFFEKSNDGFLFGDYTHIMIEFDVSSSDVDDSVLSCSFCLIGRNSDNVSDSLNLSRSNINIDITGDGDSLFVKTYNGKKIEGKDFHVVYVIEVNPENYNESRMQVFVNDILCEDSVYYGGIFADIDVDRLCSVKVYNFGTTYDVSSISFKNLKVSGYQKVGD